ncbi:MAG: SMP-30/gluconolactonase/LRE family protein [Hyphomicrobium sp.]
MVASAAKRIFAWLPAVVFGSALFAAAGAHPTRAGQVLYSSQQITMPGEYTSGIEGPAVGPDGSLYAVNFEARGTIGRLTPGANRSELFLTLPAGSIGNGIRFDPDGRMFIADYKGHNVLVVEPGQTATLVYFHSEQFNQPNDLAMGLDGTLYASDPDFKGRTGQIWRIRRGADGAGRGEIMQSDRKLGVTNGIDLGPGGDILYVSESDTRELWAYRIEGSRLTSPRRLQKFDAFDLDGLRTDTDGNIFLTRPGHGTVVVVAPDGSIVREIATRGKTPSNLTFGGPDGKTIFLTQVDGRFVESFRVDRPGREYCRDATVAGC